MHLRTFILEYQYITISLNELNFKKIRWKFAQKTYERLEARFYQKHNRLDLLALHSAKILFDLTWISRFHIFQIAGVKRKKANWSNILSMVKIDLFELFSLELK